MWAHMRSSMAIRGAEPDLTNEIANEEKQGYPSNRNWNKSIPESPNLEATSYDGTMTWKIEDYKKRKDDAIRGRQMFIYSHPFYTSRTGYKMCLRAYINGDGLGRGKCLSLFFVVMRGQYDELLEFPFRQRVTFTLLSPRNPSLNKVATFLPDSDSSSFRRPQTEMNIASGCPQFVPHSEVESSNYLISDCIYIRVAVEAGGDTIARESFLYSRGKTLQSGLYIIA
ncbi:TNF receptor-associated factor 5-like [Watersipora subatra]|uniref:TNF receptor-associated factor 5-like n=1 Tax=Watersipora subatra TaxID=2589382 RepID=UPI00355AF32A